MGLLTEGTPLSWKETKKLSKHVRDHGAQQFINLFSKLRYRTGDVFKWGDEVEYMIVRFDKDKEVAQVSLRASELLAVLNEKEMKDPDGVESLWCPEYGAYMIEGTPGKPYGGQLDQIHVVEANMRCRREELTNLLTSNETAMTITSFPRLGCPEFSFPSFEVRPDDPHSVARSNYFPDEAIFPGHPRFKNLTRNIRMRRGEKVSIKIPLYKDINTQFPAEKSSSDFSTSIELDAMGFGFGCCCVQLTLQASDINEARQLYDQLTPLCPIMLALTAASPVHNGYLADIDCRWNVISASADCRTEEERGLKPLKNNQFLIAKSRYDSIDSYLSEDGAKYNDLPLIYDEQVYQQLLSGGVDHLLAQHVAHLFIRDTVSLFSEKVDQNDKEETDHFENIQSTNWQTMRFKPPPPNTPIGWRVEFRPCEVQLTDFENAAIVCFIVLLSRVILSFKLNFLIPISKVDENMQKAQKRGACLEEKFWFRRNVNEQHNNDGFELMTIDEIINGKGGLISLVNSYLSSMKVDADTNSTIQQYLNLISKRASGKVMTTASWIRNEIINHPEYKNDSIVSDKINYDVLQKAKKIQEGLIPSKELFGCDFINSEDKETLDKKSN